MAKPAFDPLARRERQIMDVVYRLGRATAAEVQAALSDRPSYSTVRALLRVMEEKGHLRHEQDGPRDVFLPTVPRDKALLRRFASSCRPSSRAQRPRPSPRSWVRPTPSSPTKTSTDSPA